MSNSRPGTKSMRQQISSTDVSSNSPHQRKLLEKEAQKLG